LRPSVSVPPQDEAMQAWLLPALEEQERSA